MKGFDERTYGERVADVYDEQVAGMNLECDVQALAQLAGSGPALELGIGTGRVALPLASRGVQVQGIDASPSMVAKLREKPGGQQIRVFIGNFLDVEASGQFTLIYVVFNTFFALTTQEEQVQCFKNVASHLTPTGVFVMEAFVPDLTRFDRQQRLAVVDIDPDRVELEASTHNTVEQTVTAQQVVLTQSGIRLYPVKIRYAYPSELDLMARLANMRLKQRWGGWHGEPFTAATQRHVSIWELDPTPSE